MKEEYLKTCRQHANEIGLLNDTDVVRLIGFADDGEDYYWIVAYPSHICGKEKIVYSSMVGPWVSLKGIYPRYDALEKQFIYWNCLQRDFIVDETNNNKVWFDISVNP